MAIPREYPNGTITWDTYADDGLGGREEFDLDQTFCVLLDGQDAIVGTVGPHGGTVTPGIGTVPGGNYEYQVENWPLGGTAGTGVMQVSWYVIGTGGGTVAPYPFSEYIYEIVTAPSGGYCNLYDLAKYGLEGATNYYSSDDDGNAMIAQAYNWLNRNLEAILPDVTVPIATNADGLYDQHLIDMNACMTIYYLARRRHGNEFLEEPEWISLYRDDVYRQLEAIGSRNIILSEQTSMVESGIGGVTVGTANVGSALMHSDRFGYKGVYQGEEFPRHFAIEIDGTGANSDISDSTFKWSADNGVTWTKTGVSCATGWIELVDNAHIRWERVGATTNQVIYADRWTFTCTPLEKAIAGAPRRARSHRGLRG
jgi:hypothetical protein